MARILIFFTEKKALSYLILATLVIFGVGSAFTIQRESSPEVQIPIAVVTSTLPGASPEDVELLVVREIEQAVANIDGIKKLTSTSREGVGTVVVEFDADEDIDESIDKVKDEVDRAQGDLPDDASDPIVSDVNFADQPVILASIVSELPVTEFRDEAEELAEEIEGIAGVSRADITGIRDPQVTVIVRKEALALHSLSLSDVVRAIQSNDVSTPVGALTVDGVEYAIELKGRLEDPSEVAGIPLTTPAGATVYLRDIAFVDEGVEAAQTLSRVSIDGAAPVQAATLAVYKQRGADITRVSRDINALLEERNTAGNLSAEVVVTLDSGEQIIADLTQLTRTGLQTVGLVLLVLFVVLGWREALIASLSIPLSFMTALTVMNWTGNTINFISLFSLILSIGILVDTAIVMTEAIHTNVKRGLSKLAAVREAIQDFSYPVTTGNLTTIAVFFPLFTISGVTGEFIASIPFTVIAVLVSSLVISLAFIPLIASTFLHRESSTMEGRQEVFADTIRSWYRTHIVWLLDSRRRKRWFVSLLTLLLIVLMTLPAFGVIRVAFFPQSDVDYLYINIEEPQGTPLSRTDLAVRTVEEAVQTVPEVEFFTTTVGAGSPFDDNSGQGPRFGSITINLREDRERTSTQVLAEIEQRLAPYNDIDYRVLQPSEGPPSGAPVLVTFYGDDIEELKLLANDAADVLRDVEGARAVSSSGEDDASEFALSIDRAKAAELGISPAQVASTLRTAVFGTDATTIKAGGEEIDVVVKLNLNSEWQTVDDTNRATLDALYELPIPTPRGAVLLGSVLTSSLEASSDTIRREDEKRIATASSQVEDGFVAGEVSAAFRSAFEEQVVMPDGVTMKIGGETEDVDQSFRDTFRALGMGILFVFAVLVVQFNQFRQALIVLTVVPLSLIGVLLGLLITREYLSFPSMLGFIALAGIVVNNAIILVDVWNRMRRDRPDMTLREIVIEGAALRLRPILLTTVTTIVGITPLIFASDLWRPIAVAIIFGLLFAVVLTLMLVPALYLKFCKRMPGTSNDEDDTHGSHTPLPVSEENRATHVSALLNTDRYKVSSLLKAALVGVAAVLLLIVPSFVGAYTYNNENITRVYHEAPASFSVDSTAEAIGTTISGMHFAQRNVTIDPAVRLQRFEIGLAFWYVSDRGVIWADSDLAALSIYLSRVA